MYMCYVYVYVHLIEYQLFHCVVSNSVAVLSCGVISALWWPDPGHSCPASVPEIHREQWEGEGRDVRQAGREDTREREVLMSERGSQGGMTFGEGELDEKRSSWVRVSKHWLSLMGSMDTMRQDWTEEDDDSSSIDLGKVSNRSITYFGCWWVFDNIFTKATLSITFETQDY